MTATPTPQRTAGDGDAFRHFQNTMRALLAVPKKEIDEQAAKWKRRKNKKKKAAHGRIAT